MKSIRVLAIVLLSIFSQLSFAQTSDKIANDLSKLFNQLNTFGLYNKNDSLIDTINGQIEAEISMYVKKKPDALAKAFPKLGAISSPDSVLSILSWNNQTGGTQYSFTNLFLYKINGHFNYIYYDSLPGDGEYEHYYSHISTFRAESKTYYLITYEGTLDINERIDGIQIFCIENGRLNNKAKLIKTSTGLTYRLRYRYRFNLESEGMVYNAETKEITFPIIDENERETSNSMIYKFTGKYFERIKNKSY